MMGKLGAGSFGIVYKAKNRKNAEVCVIKEIDISKLDARLKKWVNYMSNLGHE
jgi:serine/threonine protein kinase